jgi:hypothetical protein
MKEPPNLLRLGTKKNEVVRIFVEGAGEAGSGSGDVVPEALFISGETPLPS